MRKIEVIIVVAAALLITFMLAPLNISQYQLNAAQRQSLCNALADTDPEDWGSKNL